MCEYVHAPCNALAAQNIYHNTCIYMVVPLSVHVHVSCNLTTNKTIHHSTYTDVV